MYKKITCLILIIMILTSCSKEPNINDEINIVNQIILYEQSSQIKYSQELEKAILGLDGSDLRPLLLRDMMDVRLIKLAKYIETKDDRILELSQFEITQSIHSDFYKSDIDKRFKEMYLHNILYIILRVQVLI